MDHPLDESEPARKLLRMAANAMADDAVTRIRASIAIREHVDAMLNDPLLQLTVGVDVGPNGKACFSATRWREDGTGEIIDHGTLPPKPE